MFKLTTNSIVEKKYFQTAYLYEKMETSTFEQFEYETYLDAYINSLRNITFAMQKEGAQFDWFKEWYKKIQDELRKNNILAFFSELRNYSIKEWTNMVSWNSWFEMRHMISYNWNGVIRIEILTQLWKKVDEIVIDDPNFDVLDPQYWYCERMYFFDEIEGKDLENITLHTINYFAYSALIFMKRVVNEYMNLYKQNQKD